MKPMEVTAHPVILSARRARRISFSEHNAPSHNEIPSGFVQGRLRRFAPQNDVRGSYEHAVDLQPEQLPLERKGALRWVALIALLLLGWWLRLVWLEAVPPGWRDDELIETFALSGQVLEGHFPIYFLDASGHEPLFHYLRAGVLALLGTNVLSGHLLSASFGLLAIALTYALARRLFGTAVAAPAALALAVSFWSLMYSRIGLRQISLPPFVLLVLYLLWTPWGRRRPMLGWAIPLGLMLGVSLYTYTASRVLLPLVMLFGLYLALFHCQRWRDCWRGYALALGIAVVVALPLALAIQGGRDAAAAQGIGADARVVELARPVWALLDGDPCPLWETAVGTLGMFHATGDPEALYNIPGRPVFNLFGGALFWLGVLICLLRWREARRFLLLLWLGLGLLPAMLSVPAASLSHSLVVQPLAYLLPVLAVVDAGRWLAARWKGNAARRAAVLAGLLLGGFLLSTAARDLGDYFLRWPADSLVRFLYRADYRQAARYLDAQTERADWAVGSLLMGPWDRLALQVDARRDDLAVRLFDPQRALVYTGDAGPSALLLTSFPALSPTMAQLVQEGAAGAPVHAPPLTLYRVAPPPERESLGRFENGLELVSVGWAGGELPAPGRQARLLLGWRVAGPLQLPPLPIVANPPPPGVYNGPRLAVFTHLLDAGGTLLTGDDGLWVDPLTLRPGDRFVQLHLLTLPADAPEAAMLEVGLYDPYTGERWPVQTEGSDRLLFDLHLTASPRVARELLRPGLSQEGEGHGQETGPSLVLSLGGQKLRSTSGR